jgi:hypothetical protein
MDTHVIYYLFSNFEEIFDVDFMFIMRMIERFVGCLCFCIYEEDVVEGM